MDQPDNIDYREVLADLESKYAATMEDLKRLQEREVALRASIQALKRLIELESRSDILRRLIDAQLHAMLPPLLKDAFAGLGIIEAAYKYLRHIGMPQSNRELTDALIEHGFETESKSPAETVRISLKQRGAPMGIVFIQGKWWLAEWPHTPSLDFASNSSVFIQDGKVVDSDGDVIAE